jgi:hypothetical protein
MPNNRSGDGKNNLGAQISKISLNPSRYEPPPLNGAPPWMPEALDKSAWMNEAYKALETLQNDRSELGYLPGEVPSEMMKI